MVAKRAFARQFHSPTHQICKKRIRISNPAKRKRRCPADRASMFQFRSTDAQSPELHKPRLRIKNRLPSRIDPLNRSFFHPSRHHQNIRPPRRRNRLSQHSRRQHRLLLQIPRFHRSSKYPNRAQAPDAETHRRAKTHRRDSRSPTSFPTHIDPAPLRIERHHPTASATTRSRRSSRPIPYTRGSKSPRSSLPPKTFAPTTTPSASCPFRRSSNFRR